MYGWTSEHLKWRLIMGCAVLFLVSMVMSCQELRYLAWGKTTEAQIVRDQVERDPSPRIWSQLFLGTRPARGPSRTRRVVIFTFQDGQRFRKEFDEVPMDWTCPPPGATIQVQYIAGKDYQSRLAGTHQWGWVTLFIVSVAAMVVAVAWTVRATR